MRGTRARATGRTAAALLAAATVGAAALAAQKPPDEALAALVAGNERFAAGKATAAQDLGDAARRTLARGENPFAIVVCCADSRVPPELVFDAPPGALYVVRASGNGFEPEAAAAVEYAAERLGGALCVVLGHEDCAAVASCAARLRTGADAAPPSPASPATPKAAPAPTFANARLLDGIEPALRRAAAANLTGTELLHRAEEEHAHATVHDLLRR